MHVRERVNLSPQVNTSKLFELKKKLNAAPNAGEDDLDFNIDSNVMDNLNENINLYIFKEEILDCIKKLKNHRASGEDGIINEYIKSTAHLFINIYTPGKPDGLNIMLSKLKGICNFRLRPSVEENLQTCAR